jgi:hypothetical protein
MAGMAERRIMTYDTGRYPPPPPPPPPPAPRRNWYQRAWATFRSWPLWVQVPTGVFGGLFLLGLVASPFVEEEEPDTEAAAVENTTTTEPPTTTSRDSTTAETTTTTEPPTTTTTAPPPAVYEGTGTQVVEIALPDADQAAIATITHTGGGNFAVWELDANLNQVELLVNQIGNYAGTVAVNLTEGVTTSSLEVTADGTWRIEIKRLLNARQFDAQITGTGDDVVAYSGEAQVVALSHQGDANFAVWFYGDQSDLLANEIGPYNATVPLSAGPALLVITANGAWSISPA